MAIAPIPVTLKPAGGTIAGLKMAMSAGAIPAGSVVYLNASDKLAVSTNTSQAASKVAGIAVSTAEGADQPVFYAPPGTKIVASGFTAGTAYYLAAAGDICLYGDLLSTEWVSLVAVAESSTVLRVLGQQLAIQIA